MHAKLKQRLVGATVVSALVVIFLPMLFDEKIDVSQSEDFSIPEFPRDFENDNLVVPKSVIENESEQPSKGKKMSEVDVLPETGKSNLLDNALSAWVVQAGSFSDEKNANQLRDKLRKAGYPAFVEAADGNRKSMFRVRVGPELDRNRADRYLKKLKEVFAIEGLVVAYP